MKQNYDRLTIEEFGTHLIQSNDLDPVYVALHDMQLPPEVLGRWLLAYWCFYDCGVASYIASYQGQEFWTWMMVAAVNGSKQPTPFGERWRRASERRHFRGTQAIRAVDELTDRYGDEPESMAYYCAVPHRFYMTEEKRDDGLLHPTMVDKGIDTTCADVMKRAKEHRGFGDWIAFKVADMAERVMGIPVSFDKAEVFMFKSPVEAAQVLWKQTGRDPQAVKKWVINEWAVTHLTTYFSHYQAPPRGDRPIGLQEVETILCKWKSHMNGHYPLFNDQDEINHHLQPWLEHSDLARQFHEYMPKHGGYTAPDGTMMNDDGTRSIFCDVDK